MLIKSWYCESPRSKDWDKKERRHSLHMLNASTIEPKILAEEADAYRSQLVTQDMWAASSQSTNRKK